MFEWIKCIVFKELFWCLKTNSPLSCSNWCWSYRTWEIENYYFNKLEFSEFISFSPVFKKAIEIESCWHGKNDERTQRRWQTRRVGPEIKNLQAFMNVGWNKILGKRQTETKIVNCTQITVTLFKGCIRMWKFHTNSNLNRTNVHTVK